MSRRPFIQVHIVDNSVQKTVNELTKINKDFERDLIAVLETSATDIINDTIIPGFPFQFGTLKGSYQPDKVNTREMSVEAGSIVDYAPNVELGLGQPARPYFFPSVDKNEIRFNKAIEKLIEKHT